MCSSSPPAPDFGPTAAASEKAAQLGYDLGKEQLTESQRQYDLNTAVAKPVVDAQLGIMGQTAQQGDDYYKYLQEYRPAERQLLYDANGLSADQVAEINTLRAQEEADYQGRLAAARQAYENDLLRSVGVTPPPGGVFDLSQIKDVAVPEPQYGKIGLWGPNFPRSSVSIRNTRGTEVASNQAEIDAAKQQNALNAQVRASLGGIQPVGAPPVSRAAFDPSRINKDSARSDALTAKYISQGQSALQARDSAERELLTGSDTSIYNNNASDIDAMVGRAVADAQGGYTRSLNQTLRQGRRYGLSGNAVAAGAGNLATSQASAIASAANGTRQQGIDATRNRLNTRRSMRIQDDAANWGKRLDAVGLAKGMPGASQGAYSLATNAGTNAVGNQMAPGAAFMAGNAAGTGTIMQGQGMKMQGLGSILNAQTSMYNAGAANSGGLGGALLGAAEGLGSAWIMKPSDRRLKTNIVQVGKDARTGLDLYEFNYKEDLDTRWRGVMADDVEQILPDAVVYNSDGYAMVNYGMLGIPMVEV